MNFRRSVKILSNIFSVKWGVANIYKFRGHLLSSCHHRNSGEVETLVRTYANALNATNFSKPTPLLEIVDNRKKSIHELRVLFPNAHNFYFEGFTSIPTALTANDRNRRIQVYQASDG